ncbi:hypothetical protein AC578_6963 [Pseudocercospora eumusae]|uniref:Uncharacterized protein n=1 Tax=Pseudocercospora eumusae TaxID=321146 RepID=A0A139H9C9_9PEZI|nr:hypothetical protein AC578_6963 [Pseudocercospora eumusae]
MANLKLLLCMIFCCATLSLASIEDIQLKIRALKKADDDLIFIGDDGVVRVFNTIGLVHNYVQLTNEELALVESDKVEKKFTLTDGRNVEHKHCMDPPQHILPKIFQAKNIGKRALAKRFTLCTGNYCDATTACVGTPAEVMLCPSIAQL